MGRRKNSSDADAIVDLVAMMPWWVGVALAITIYVGLHAYATQAAPPTPKDLGQFGGFTIQTMFRTLASIGQYLLPFMCLVGAVVSAIRQRQRRKLVDTVTANPTANVIDGLTWQQFERLVGESFRLQGYRVVETGGHGADGGVDLVLSRNGEKHLVQCKQWRAFKVGVDVVRQLYGVMAAQGAASGFVVTSGRFTNEAIAFAQGRNVQLIDGPKLQDWIRQAQRSTPSAAMHVQRTSDTAASPTLDDAASPPTCPQCTRPMVRRVAGKGANAGQAFWGCPSFPGCRGTRPGL